MDPSIFGKSLKESPRIMEYAGATACNKIFRRTLFTECCFTFPEDQAFPEEAVIFSIMLTAGKIQAIDYPAVNRTVWRGAVNSVEPFLTDAFKSISKTVAYYKNNGASDAVQEELGNNAVSFLYGRRFAGLIKNSNRKTAREYISRTIDYLDETFPKWRNCRTMQTAHASKKKKLSWFVKTNKVAFNLYTLVSKKLFSFAKKHMVYFIKRIRGFLKQADKRQNTTKGSNTEAIKRKNIQSHGIQVMGDTQKLLKTIGVKSVADFGTCLGLVREGHLLKHDIDMDIGVIAAPEQRDKIRITLERKGYQLWRQYVFNGAVVEESYHYKDIKVDFNYYVITPEYARTWLFYREPGYVYPDKYTRHEVEMNYSPITSTHDQVFDGVTVMLPDEPDKLMEEKYGPNWRIPDTGWIYWKSPAATLLPDTSFFILYNNKNRKAVKE